MLSPFTIIREYRKYKKTVEIETVKIAHKHGMEWGMQYQKENQKTLTQFIKDLAVAQQARPIIDELLGITIFKEIDIKYHVEAMLKQDIFENTIYDMIHDLSLFAKMKKLYKPTILSVMGEVREA